MYLQIFQVLLLYYIFGRLASNIKPLIMQKNFKSFLIFSKNYYTIIKRRKIMQKFRFKYSMAVWILLSLVLVLTAGGIIWNIFNLIEYSWAGAFKIIIYSFIIFLTACIFVFVLFAMINGCYLIKNGFLYTCFGLIKNKVCLDSVTQITHFTFSNKLVLYFNDQKYSVIVIPPERYDDFIKAVRENNHAILFNSYTDEPNART
jgi:hypothetical protein